MWRDRRWGNRLKRRLDRDALCGWTVLFPKDMDYKNKNLSVIHETHPVRCWLRCLQRFPPNNQTITAALG